MFNYDVKFLTCDDVIHLKSGDFKSFKYDTKKRPEETIHDCGKRNYCERRGGHWRVPRSRQLKQLESYIRERSIISCEWTEDSTATLVFSSGAIAYLTVKPTTLDITQVLFDQYCVGKLMGQTVCCVVICKTHLLFTHADRIATLISFGKIGSSFPSRISEKEPHIQSFELGGGGRRTERRVTWCENSSGVRVLVWSATASEPAPWSPIPQDHANLHLYQINGQQAALIAYHQLENDVLSAEISQKSDNIIHIVQQITCQKNVVNLEWLRYDLQQESRVAVTKMASLRESATRVCVPAPARAARRADCDTRLLIACIDGSVHVIHHIAGLVNTTRAGFIATDVRWTGQLAIAAEEAGRLQCFDRALSLLHHHTKCLDLTSYLRESKRIQILATRNTTGGSMILAAFSGGPLTLLRIMHPRLLSAWIRSGRMSNAVALLRAMDWEREGPECLRAVDEILRGALRRSDTFETGEQHAQAALGAFLAPSAPLSSAAMKYGPPLYDLARKFFHHLLRRGRVEKALCLGVDVCAWDLFCDARWAAVRCSLPHLAAEAAHHARSAHHDHPHTARVHDSECSDSCSQCSSRSYSDSEEEASVAKLRTNPPPLPRVPLPNHPTLLQVPIAPNEQLSTNSIRPNLHQYVDRDNTIWGTNVKDDTFISAKDYEHFNPVPNAQNIRWNSVDNVLLSLKKPAKSTTDAFAKTHADVRQQEDRVPHFKHLYQTELRDGPDTYRFHSNSNLYLSTTNFNGRYPQDNNFWSTSRPPEKNKVKFSDTVTIAVMSEPASPDASCELPRELHRDLPRELPREIPRDLPRCSSHKYPPYPGSAASTAPGAAVPLAGTTLDYVEV